MVNGMEGTTGNNNIYGLGYGLLPGTTTTTMTTPAAGGGGTTLFPPVYGAATLVESFPAKADMKSDSSLTYSIPPAATALSRKRSRNCVGMVDDHQFLPLPQQNGISNQTPSAAPFTFQGQDVSFQIHQQQIEIDRFIARHAAKMRVEIEESRNSYSRRIITAVEETVMKKLKAKEEEIDKIGKLNSALEERVNSLCLENQLWREMAQTNEAAVNALRNNLNQAVVAHHQRRAAAAASHLQQGDNHGNEALQDDAQSSSSCCGSNNLPVNATATAANENEFQQGNAGGREEENGGGKLCRNCGKEEAIVLLLPCRHLCLCALCGASLHTCPICLCSNNASLHINLSSSYKSRKIYLASSVF